MFQLLKLEENTKLKLETSCGRSITFTNSVPINDTETEDDTIVLPGVNAEVVMSLHELTH